MSATTHRRQKLFGMFELDSSNRVVYSRFEGGEGGAAAPPAVNGASLEDAGAAFTNADELRRRINAFRSNGAHADSFDFTFEYEDGPVPVRVLMARVSESSERGSTKSVLIHVRQRR
ncbi:MAG TPA: hypothetical protein VK422_05210 [Pyrinomonadaceae bacterium]|nr:hypothetical protein [Pyrinomonadaceae bacterium]